MNISDDRIKIINASINGYKGDEEYLTELVLREISYGIILKLREFHKVKIINHGDYISVECSLQIIVPPRVTSNRPIPSIPSPE